MVEQHIESRRRRDRRRHPGAAQGGLPVRRDQDRPRTAARSRSSWRSRPTRPACRTPRTSRSPRWATTSSPPTRCVEALETDAGDEDSRARHGRRHHPDARRRRAGRRSTTSSDNDVPGRDRPRPRLLARRRDARRATTRRTWTWSSVHPVFNLYNRDWPIFTSHAAAAAGASSSRTALGAATSIVCAGLDRLRRQRATARCSSPNVRVAAGARRRALVLLRQRHDRPGRGRPQRDPRQERRRPGRRADRRRRRSRTSSATTSARAGSPCSARASWPPARSRSGLPAVTMWSPALRLRRTGGLGSAASARRGRPQGEGPTRVRRRAAGRGAGRAPDVRNNEDTERRRPSRPRPRLALPTPTPCRRTTRWPARWPTASPPTASSSIGTDPTYEPNEFKDGSGKIVGFDVDLGTAIAKKLGLTAEFQESKFDAILPALGTRVRASACRRSPTTKEREKVVDFVTYFNAGTAVGVEGQPTFDPDNACGKKVAVQTGTVQDTDDLPAQSKKCAWPATAIVDQRYDDQDRGHQRRRARQGRRGARRLAGHRRRRSRRSAAG